MRIVHCLHEGRALCGKMEIPRDWPAEHAWVSLDDWLSREDLSELKDPCGDCAAAVRDRLLDKAERALDGLTPGGTLTASQAGRFLDHLVAGMREEEVRFKAHLADVRERLVALCEGEPDETVRRVLLATEEPGSDVTLALYAAFLERGITRLKPRDE